MTNLQMTCLPIVRRLLEDPRVAGAGWLTASWVMAQISTECDWNPRPSSDGLGSLGLMQVLPETAREMGVYGDQAFPENSILAGMRYLAECRRVLTASLGRAPRVREIVTAYNAGPGAVAKGALDTAYWNRWLGRLPEWLFVDSPEAQP